MEQKAMTLSAFADVGFFLVLNLHTWAVFTYAVPTSLVHSYPLDFFIFCCHNRQPSRQFDLCNSTSVTRLFAQ